MRDSRPSEPKYLTTSEAASILRISPKTMKKWRGHGEGPPATKMGTRVAYLEADVLKWASESHGREQGPEHLKVTTRPKNNRIQVDIMFAHPLEPGSTYRKRLLAPNGHDDEQAKLWGEEKAGELFRSLFKIVAPKKEVQNEEAKPTTAPAKVPTVKQWWPEFEGCYVMGFKASTRSNYQIIYRCHIGPVLGDVPLDKVDKAAFARLRSHCKTRGHQATQINFVLQRLGRMLRVAADMDVIREESIPKFKREKVPKKHKEVFTRAEVDKLIALARTKGTYEEVLVLLVCHAVLRIGETAGLMWSDINWEEQTMAIQRNVLDGHLQPTPKGEIGEVPLSPELQDALRRHHQAQPEGEFLLPRKYKRRGQKIAHGSEKSLAKLVTELQEEAGLQACGPHRHRHTGLTHAARMGANPHALQHLARHGDPATTARYYLHFEKVELAREALAALTGSAPKGPTPEPASDKSDWHSLALPGTRPKLRVVR